MLEQLRGLANPYDFANPVSAERNFFGRTAELADIAYYLNHAKQTGRPIHLAFVGARASGKTSFLNVTQLEAKRRDFCTVRINLNETDVNSDLDFFRKLFHSTLMAAFACDAYGGRKGDLYFAYLELISTNEVKDIERLPFVFAFQLARALKSGNLHLHVADDILLDDLQAISTEVKRPIVILFDECNVLRANRGILEKLRNIFMNMTGYMLVFAATDDFFPIMDEVFSPIMRQFKKVEIGPFKRGSDVADCILKPLEHLGISDSNVHKLVSTMFVSDVDKLSSRRPYEIQLICHTVFRRCQQGQVRRFGLDLKTLESIQQELASGQNIGQRPIIRSAKEVKRKTLSLLDHVGNSTESLRARDWWRLEYLLYGSARWSSEAAYLSGIRELEEAGLLSGSPDGLAFSGDDFDRIYVKYIARQKGLVLRSLPVGLEMLIFSELNDGLPEFRQFETIGIWQTGDQSDDVYNVCRFLEPGMLTSTLDFHEDQLGPIFEDLVQRTLEADEGTELLVFDLFLTSDLGSAQAWGFWNEPDKSKRSEVPTGGRSGAGLVAGGHPVLADAFDDHGNVGVSPASQLPCLCCVSHLEQRTPLVIDAVEEDGQEQSMVVAVGVQ